MIISKTPYRISFLVEVVIIPHGIKNMVEKFYPQQLINIFIYLVVSLQNILKKYRIVWRKIENVQTAKEINHKAVRELLKYLKIKPGLEIHYYGDLPARSGMGLAHVLLLV